MNLPLPNAFIVGAQKAGTSTFYDWLGQHPDIFAPPEAKDLPFFSDNFNYSKGLDFYSRFFKNYKEQKVILAGGVHEVMSEEALQRLSSLANIKIFFILRNPIERAYSAYNFNRDRRIETIESFYEVLTIDENREIYNKLHIREFNYIGHGYYDEQLIILKKYFRESQIQVIFFDDIKQNKQEVVNSALKFLDIQAYNQINFKIVNKSAIPKFPLINKILFSSMGIKDMIKNMKIFEWLFPTAFRIRLRRKLLQMNKTNTSHPPIDNKSKNFLISIYASHISSLEKLTSRDLKHWLE